MTLYPIHPNGQIYPPRFRNRADADLFVECLRTSTPYPREKELIPYTMKGDTVIVNPEYAHAPFELGYFYAPSPTLKDVSPVL